MRVRADEQVERKDSAWVPTYLKKERERRKKEEDLWEGRVDVEFSFRFFFYSFSFFSLSLLFRGGILASKRTMLLPPPSSGAEAPSSLSPSSFSLPLEADDKTSLPVEPGSSGARVEEGGSEKKRRSDGDVDPKRRTTTKKKKKRVRPPQSQPPQQHWARSLVAVSSGGALPVLLGLGFAVATVTVARAVTQGKIGSKKRRSGEVRERVFLTFFLLLSFAPLSHLFLSLKHTHSIASSTRRDPLTASDRQRRGRIRSGRTSKDILVLRLPRLLRLRLSAALSLALSLPLLLLALLRLLPLSLSLQSPKTPRSCSTSPSPIPPCASCGGWRCRARARCRGDLWRRGATRRSRSRRVGAAAAGGG